MRGSLAGPLYGLLRDRHARFPLPSHAIFFVFFGTIHLASNEMFFVLDFFFVFEIIFWTSWGRFDNYFLANQGHVQYCLIQCWSQILVLMMLFFNRTGLERIGVVGPD